MAINIGDLPHKRGIRVWDAFGGRNKEYWEAVGNSTAHTSNNTHTKDHAIAVTKYQKWW